jgi:hypothetical protein
LPMKQGDGGRCTSRQNPPRKQAVAADPASEACASGRGDVSASVCMTARMTAKARAGPQTRRFRSESIKFEPK